MNAVNIDNLHDIASVERWYYDDNGYRYYYCFIIFIIIEGTQIAQYSLRHDIFIEFINTDSQFGNAV